ncbi:hypothetical protein PTSG_07011 [Salpingoeca rosetta]|uniref:GyrI-like small molecule binding domain-containing protein n=1 Tax=Salpingoeca rosetta (strain ATCC 50818 / BSB-021) TaxID=946362 RepID=F2UDS8_SALR5|nr:uncharacterized protein PTSG_07011 [Salpingoeca rosetta]EGD74778.1 hypothetical protein PTSG_07011 [Salpingoeca rosetta]|eukprot:XP_004992423.1 hypothetical protein PTSG_07011 [Salpingoeca rosetta]
MLHPLSFLGCECDLVTVALVVVLVVVLLLAYMGVFQAVRFVPASIPKCQIAGFTHIGPYQNIGSVFEKVEKIQKELKLEHSFFCGLYHDDPSVTAKDKLRAFAGMAFEKPLDEETLTTLKEKGMRVRHETDEIPCYTTYFPFRNVLSYMLGPMLVYPRINKKSCPGMDCSCEEEGGIMEIYHDDFIQFMIPRVGGKLFPLKDL